MVYRRPNARRCNRLGLCEHRRHRGSIEGNEVTQRTVIVFLLAVLGALSGCDPGVVLQPPMASLSDLEARDTRKAIDQWVGSSGRALFLCGQSDGLGVFTASWEDGYSTDGITDGRIAFILRAEGKADVVFRDATGRYTSSVDDGAEVIRISKDQVESWVIIYAGTGIVETHNIVSVDNQLIDLWTANKPQSVIGASAKLFRAPCVRA